jgi:hypothetical protein
VLRERTRDSSRFRLVFEENVDYGFRRNCLGLRPYALTIASGALILSLVFLIIGEGHGRWSRWGISLLVAFAALIYWGWMVRPEWVRRSAELYADRLYEAAHTLRAER